MAISVWNALLPHSALAFLLDRLRQGRVHITVTTGIQREIHAAVSGAEGDRFDAVLAQDLANNVPLVVETLREAGFIDFVREDLLLRPALMLTAEYHLPLADMLAVALAQYSGLPLLVADDAVAEQVHRCTRNGLELTAVRLEDYMRR